MRNKLSVASFLIWGLIALLLLGVLVSGLTGRLHINSIIGSRYSAEMDLLREGRFPAGDVTNLDISCAYEDIRVKLVEGDTVTVRQYGDSSRDLPFEDGKKAVDGGYQLKIEVPHKTLDFSFGLFRGPYLEVELPSGYGNNLSLSAVSGNVDFPEGYSGKALSISNSSGDVTLGAGSPDSLTISTVSGNINLGDAVVAGDTKISSMSGDIRAADISARNANLKSTSGNVGFGELTAGIRADISTMSGDMRGGALKGAEFDCGSVSGNMTLDKALSGGGRLHTSSGNVAANGVIIDGALAVNTVSGNVRLSLGPSQGCDLKFSTVSGNLRSSAPLLYTDKNGKNATAAIGGGGPPLTISTTSGDATLDT